MLRGCHQAQRALDGDDKGLVGRSAQSRRSVQRYNDAASTNYAGSAARLMPPLTLLSHNTLAHVHSARFPHKLALRHGTSGSQCFLDFKLLACL